MNINSFIISVLVSVICVLISLLQHVYFNYRRVTEMKLYYKPVFEDLIPSDKVKNFKVQKDKTFGRNSGSNVLKSLHARLKFPMADTLKRPAVPLKPEAGEATEKEVYYSVQAALKFKSFGKLDKALKLFEHAAVIAPNNPDVLNRYGEFIEQMLEDIVSADELYLKALTQSPNHKDALMNHKRTAHIVDQLDLEVLENIDKKCEMLKKLQNSDPAFEDIKRQAFYLHIYHTVGIEGNTMTVEQLRYLLETGNAIAGKSIVEHNEILGLELAMNYLKILTRFPVITVNEIKGIHRRIMGHVDPLNSGIFRDKQVFVGSHKPPPPDDVPKLMEEYAEWLNSEDAVSMHPVRYAALAHYKLVDIHPFGDGNGRTSRLIMNLILLRAGYPPVIILKEHRQQYYDYLQLANHGDVRPFVRFIAQCTEHILNMYLWSLENIGRLSDTYGDLKVIDTNDQKKSFETENRNL
ncbi:adenosine monophosphate-protein transferase Fic [Agrilus planipennis]|uniref:Protein adenylyltransferase Fic n=1 Tax=Agrilus planipennis TaxID=224129 RepID=A0A1W4X0H1_AGRPL|nr:adenosine monophosphate-protein transferase Fic [Agrilus planipennis]